MESHAIYLAKIQSLRKSLNEKTLTGYPVFKNSQNLEEFLGKKNKTFTHFNRNETIINFKEFDEKIKPNKIYRSNTNSNEEEKTAFIKLQYSNKPPKDDKPKPMSEHDNSNELIKSKSKFESILTTVGVSKKLANNNTSFSNDLSSDSLLTVKLKQEKNSTNKINKNFNSSIDGKKIEEKLHHISPLVIESLPTSAKLMHKSDTNIDLNRTSQTNFSLPKMNSQYSTQSTSSSILNDIMGKSNQMSTLNSVKKIRKLLCLDDISMPIEPLKSKPPRKNVPKVQKLRTALTLTKSEISRVNSGLSEIYPPDTLSKMLVNTKIARPNNLTPIESFKKKIVERPKSHRPNTTDDQLNTSNDYQSNYVDRKSYTEFSLKVIITDRSRCPPTTPNEKLDHKNDNCLLCASLAKGNLFNDSQDFITPSANLQLQRQYEQYLLSMN